MPCSESGKIIKFIFCKIICTQPGIILKLSIEMLSIDTGAMYNKGVAIYANKIDYHHLFGGFCFDHVHLFENKFDPHQLFVGCCFDQLCLF